MPRPKTKKELCNLSQENFTKIFDLINSLTEAEQNGSFPFEHRDKNIRDVLAHLHQWHLMMLRWYDEGMQGKKPAMPDEGYTWKTTAELNQKIWEQYQTTDLVEVRKKLQLSFESLQTIMQKHIDEELFEKKRYAWTGTTSLGSYLISATSSHYDWALKWLRKYKKSLK